MHHIGQHISGKVPTKKKSRDTERGELMEYFMRKLNIARKRDGLGALTMGRMGRLLVAIPTKDLYYLKSVCDDADKRNGLDAFCKKFWWEIKPRREEDKEKSTPKKTSRARRNGFTLIELLVVIAIVGVLASFVIASLGSARAKGNDSAVKANLHTAIVQAELYMLNNNSYGPVFTSGGCPTTASATMFYTDLKIRTAIAAAAQASGDIVLCAAGGANVNAADTYAIASPLKSVVGGYWCNDSGGRSKLVTEAAAPLAWLGIPTARAAGGPNLGGGSVAAACP